MGTRDDDDVTKQTSRAALLSDLGHVAHPSLIVLAGAQVGEMFRLNKSEMVIGREANSDIQLLDDSVSRRHARISVFGDELHLDDLGSRNGTSLNGQPVAHSVLREGDKIQLGAGTLLRFTRQDAIDEDFQRRMLDSALRDGLTGAFNKRYFVERLENELRFALRHRSPLSLLLLDLDHFKRVNDSFGHLAGDAVLTTFARVVQETIRVEDVLTRYGGEEFAVIGRGVDPGNARVLGERIRARVTQTQFESGAERINVTVSIGIAGLPDLAIRDTEALIRSADNALYAAKAAGRDRVEVASGIASTASLGANEAPRSRKRHVTQPNAMVTDPAERARLGLEGPAPVAPSSPRAPRVTIPPKK